jgi:hypothetical protein
MEKETSEKVELSERSPDISTQPTSVDGSTPEAPRDSMNLRERIQSTFRLFRNKLSFVGLDSEDETKLREEVGYLERQATVDGVNFSRIQIEKVLSDRDNGRKIEFETFSPYLSDYNTATGEVWENNLINCDKIGIRLIGLMRKIFPRARVISLYDEYNSNMPDSENHQTHATSLAKEEKDITSEGVNFEKEKYLLKGAPYKDDTVKQIEYSEESKINFRQSVGNIISRECGEDCKEGEDYLLISESSKIADAETLVARLESLDLIRRDGREITFVNNTAENPFFPEITLRSKGGRWLCEALDASSYIKPENLDITHIVVLPNSFKEQQDKVWEMLKCLGIEPLNYHNIFYDESKDPEDVARIVKEEFAKYEKDHTTDKK